MLSQQKTSYHFVQVSHPKDSAKWKRQVRVHAARNSHARQEKVNKYLVQKAKEDERINEGSQLHANNVSQISHASYIMRVLSAASTDPFDTFIQRLGTTEKLLFHYCEFY
jgi:hypothetical protein